MMTLIFRVKVTGQCQMSKSWQKTKEYLDWYFIHRLHTWYQSTTQLCAFNELSNDDLDLRWRSKVKVKFSPKWVKKQRTGHISEAISFTDFILGTKVQPNKAHSMTQVPMTFTKVKGQGQIFPKMCEKPKNWSYLGGYFTYTFHTWYQGTTQ